MQPGGQVKIVDFGLARLGASEMTKTGMVMGTPHYMSPEQVRGQKADVRSDVFSLGAVFYEMLANRKPFDAESLHALFFQVLEQDPAPVQQWDPELPEALATFLARALAKDAAQRYQNAGEMREALRAARHAMVGEAAAQPAQAVTAGGAASGPAPAWSTPVQGSAALAPERRPVSRPAQPRTLPGASATAAGAPVVARSRAPLAIVAGGAALAVLLTGGAYFVLRGRGASAPQPANAGPPGLEIVTRQLVLTKLQLAETKVEMKDFKGAALEAQQVLELDPANAEARRIQERVQAIFAQLEEGATQARAAVKAGDLETASAALQRVIAIDPQHPVASELARQLDSRFREQADEARRAMKRSQALAEQARAESQRGFVEAVASGREAEVLFARAEFTGAAQKFLDSRDNFERARRAALEKQVAPSMAPAPFVTARPATAPPMQAAGPTPAAAPGALPAAAAARAPSGDEHAAVLRVIADYERAIEGKDLGLYRRIWPTLSRAEEKKLQAAFQMVQDHDVRIRVDSVKVEGGRATVKLARNDTMKGKPVGAVTQTVNLVKQGEAWTISTIGQ